VQPQISNNKGFRIRIAARFELARVLRAIYPAGKSNPPTHADKSRFSKATLDPRFINTWEVADIGPFGGILNHKTPEEIKADFLESGEDMYSIVSLYNSLFGLQITYNNLRDLLFLKLGEKISEIKLEQDIKQSEDQNESGR
jgi:hypothetical protein